MTPSVDGAGGVDGRGSGGGSGAGAGAGGSGAGSGGGRTWLILAGVVVLVVGLAGAAGLWYAAGRRLDDAVAGLARAPVGCDTVLDFDTGGEFILFVETAGTIEGVRGDCNVSGDFEWDGAEGDVPSAVLALTNQDGDEVELSPNAGVSYDSAGSVGSSVRSVTIDETGDHTLRVESSDGMFAIAVGRDPNDGVDTLRRGALAIAVVGSLVGGVLLVLGARRGHASAATAPGSATALSTTAPHGPPGWPSSPPGFPEPPPTTGATGAVGPTTAPPIRPPTGPLPVPPGSPATPVGPATPAGPATPRTPAEEWGPPRSEYRRSQ